MRCGDPKPHGSGRRLCDACATPATPVVRCAGCGVELPSARRRRCDACKATAHRAKIERSQRWNLAHPETMRAAHARYRARHPDRIRVAQRRWTSAVAADPARLERLRETKRLGARLRAERNGRPLPPVAPERYANPSYKWKVPAGPLREQLREQVSLGEHAALAADAGVSERLLYRLLHENLEHISVVAADRIAIALGLHLDLLYDEEAA